MQGCNTQKVLEKGCCERLKKKLTTPSACRAARALQGFVGATKVMDFGAFKGNQKNKEKEEMSCLARFMGKDGFGCYKFELFEAKRDMT